MKKQFKSKDFNGAACVVFSTEENAQEFIEKSKQTPIKYEDNSVLECSLQDEHYKKRALESATGGKSPDEDGREKRFNDKQIRKDKRKEESEKKTSEHLEKLNNENLSGAVIHLAGMAANATRELIKEKFNPYTKMPWIDFNKGDAEAWVRLNEANTAKDVLEKVLAAGQGKLVIGDKEVTTRVVEGEEEAQFWKEANEKRASQRTKKKMNDLVEVNEVDMENEIVVVVVVVVDKNENVIKMMMMEDQMTNKNNPLNLNHQKNPKAQQPIK